MNLKEFNISRDVKNRSYKSSLNLEEDVDTYFCAEILKRLPYILYFDDFRDSIEVLIDVPESKESENQSKWIPYFQELLKAVDNSHSIYSLRGKNANQRDSIIRSAEKILKTKLTKHWSNFNISNESTDVVNEPLKIDRKVSSYSRY